jgi:hypothetical protein
MIAAITAALSKDGLNIENFVDKSKGDFAYSILDLNATPSAKAMEELNAVDGVIRTRARAYIYVFARATYVGSVANDGGRVGLRDIFGLILVR